MSGETSSGECEARVSVDERRPSRVPGRRPKGGWRRQSHRRRLFLEGLEPRLLLASTVSLSLGDLRIEGDHADNDVKIVASGTDLVITDSTGIHAGDGVTMVDSAAHVPLAAITGVLKVNGDKGTDLAVFGAMELGGGGIETRDVEDVRVDALGRSAAAGGWDVEADSFTVCAQSVISTRRIASGDPSTAASTGDSGDIKIVAHQITIEAGSRLLAQVEEGSPFEPGLIQLQVDVGTFALPLIPQVSLQEISISIRGGEEETVIRGGEIEIEGTIKNDLTSPKRWFGYTDQAVTISIEDATIEGESIVIEAESEDTSWWEQVEEGEYGPALQWITPNLIEPAVEFVADALLFVTPFAAMVRGAKATVNVKDAEIESEGDVTIQATSVVNAEVEAVAAYAEVLTIPWKLSAGYSQAKSTAQTTIGGQSQIHAGGNVEIGTDAKNTAEVTARTTSNILKSPAGQPPAPPGNPKPAASPANPRDVVGSIAISYSDSTSQTAIEEHASVMADGNVTIRAVGTTENNAQSGATTYGDGAAGASVSVAVDDSNVRALVDGTVVAGGVRVTRTIVLADITDDTLRIENHGFRDGQIVEYRASDPDDLDGLPAWVSA